MLPGAKNRWSGRQGLDGAFSRIRATSTKGILIPSCQSEIDTLEPSSTTSYAYTRDPSGGTDMGWARSFTILSTGSDYAPSILEEEHEVHRVTW